MSLEHPTLTVVTATLDTAKVLPVLIASLEAQTDQDFEWVVADGLSSDRTAAVAKAARLPNVVVDSRADFSIYDALNRAVRLARGDYYLVLGSDDELFPDAIAHFKKALREAATPRPDIVAASVMIGRDVRKPNSSPAWRRSGNGWIGNHAVGTAFRRDLHDTVGYYSNRFVVAADMFFVRSVMAQPGARLVAADFVAGRFALGGISSADRMATLSDVFRVQLSFEKRKWLQLLLYASRVAREL